MTEWDLQKLLIGMIITELQQHLFCLNPNAAVMIFSRPVKKDYN